MRPALLTATLLSCSLLLTGCGKQAASDTASTAAPAAIAAGSAGVDLAALQETLQKIYEDRTVSNVHAAPVAGLYAFVLDDSEVFYSDPTGRYIFGGSLYDTKKDLNLTTALETRLLSAKLDKLDYSQAIKQVHGDGSRKLVVFSDPFCPSCRDLEPNLDAMKNVTIYTFLYPFIEEGRDPAHKISRKVWCDADRANAWHTWMVKNKPPLNAGSCDFPLEALMKTGKKMGLTAVPSIVFPDGTLESGGLSTEDLEERLGSADSAKPQQTARL